MKMIATFLTLLIILTSCQVGVPYTPPIVEASENWKNANSQDVEASSSEPCYYDYWWEVFEDPLLNSLENDLLSNNYDLQVSFYQMMEARGLMHIREADLYPQLFLNPLYSNEGILYESYSTRTIVRAHILDYLLPINLSYEVDLWGKICDRYQAARRNWEGQMDAYQSAMLLLTAELATVYYQLRTMDAQIDLLEGVLENRKEALEIMNSRYQFRIINYSDVTLAALEVSKTQAEYRELQRLRSELENRLAVLVGNNSSDFHFNRQPLKGDPPNIPAGIPSEVLQRRPDIAEAERRVASEHALTNAAYASFFPSLTLTGWAGFSSVNLRYFLKAKSGLWGYGANSSQMIYDGGRLEGEFEIQISRFREADAEYRQRVLVCFEEVEDALSNLENYAKELKDISDAVMWAEEWRKISDNRYNNGVTSYLDVVLSENEELLNKIAQNNLQGLRFVTTIQLIKVLGGGW